MTTIFAHLRIYLPKQFTLPVVDIATHHRLQQDLGLHAIELTGLIVYPEVLYEVTLPDESITPSLTASQLCALIDQFADDTHNSSTFLGYRQERNQIPFQPGRLAS